MSRVPYDSVEPTPDFTALPIRIRSTASRTAAALHLAMLAPVMAAFALPILVFGARAETSALAIISEQPLAALQVGLGFIIWIALFVWPLKRAIARFGADRQVEIDAKTVRVVDRSPFGRRNWCEPLADYAGIAHNVRASLSGYRHELILVHRDPAKCVLVSTTDRLSHVTFERAKQLLQLPEVPVRGAIAAPAKAAA